MNAMSIETKIQIGWQFFWMAALLQLEILVQHFLNPLSKDYKNLPSFKIWSEVYQDVMAIPEKQRSPASAMMLGFTPFEVMTANMSASEQRKWINREGIEIAKGGGFYNPVREMIMQGATGAYEGSVAASKVQVDTTVTIVNNSDKKLTVDTTTVGNKAGLPTSQDRPRYIPGRKRGK
jgi:hypothetical protein